VTSRYVGGGSISTESAEFFRQLDASRRAERAAKRETWEAERDQLRAVERQTIEIDEAYATIAEAALLASGHHRPQRGRWRKRRRQMANDIQKAQADLPPASESEMSGLLDLIERSEGNEKRALQDHAHGEIQRLLSRAKDGESRALPALRVLLARRPDYLGKLSIGDFAVKAAALAASGAKDRTFRTSRANFKP
jgi:hypothetical protein